MSDPALQDLLAKAAAEAGAEAASLALLVQGQVATATIGPVGPDTPFRLGSISKTFTAALVHLAAREGRLDLDAPVVDILAGFRLADPEATARLTTRHLLTHQGGFFGDIFEDEGTGPDALARYVRHLARAEQTVPPGTLSSYCNAGTVLAGRLAEIALGADWETLVRRRITEPLGLAATAPRLPDDAAGAVRTAGDSVPAGSPQLRSLGPAGATAFSTPLDLVQWAQALWVAPPNGLGLFAAMSAPEVAPPSPGFALGFGPGLMRFSDDGRLWGHDGAVPGQSSFLRFAPDRGVALALMVAGGDPRLLADRLFRPLLSAHASCAIPPLPDLSAPPAAEDLAALVGRWLAPRYRIDVRLEAGGLAARFAPAADAGDLSEQFEVGLLPMGNGLFATLMPGSRAPSIQQLHRDAEGRMFLSFRGRLFRRMG